MALLITALLVLHILGGFAALISGFIASITHKGGTRHRLNGRFYFWGMSVVFVTAVALGILKEKWFLFMVGFFSYYMVVRGYRILYLKKLGAGQSASRLDWAIAFTGMAFGLGLVAWSVLFEQNSFGPVPFVFGLICIGFAAKDIQLFIKGPKHKSHWIFGHIAGMGGGYIATWTAFLVTNVHFLPPVLVWLAPTVIGSTLIFLSIRKYKIKMKPEKWSVTAVVIFWATLVQAQEADSAYSLDYLKRSTSFAWLNYGFEAHGLPGGTTTICGHQEQKVRASVEPRFVISGMHFWGHADFYVAISLPVQLGNLSFEGHRVRYHHRVETGARVYPWKVAPNTIRPYVGISFRSLSFAQEQKDAPYPLPAADYDKIVFPLQAGVTYSSRKYHITAGIHYRNAGAVDYYSGPATTSRLKLLPFTCNLGVVRYLDTDKDMRTERGVKKENILYQRLKQYRKFNVAYAGIGPSAALPLTRSPYLNSHAPALHQSLPFSIMPDITLGYHFAAPDVNLGFSYRPVASRLRGYTDNIRLRRHSFMLEGYKYLFNWLGFAPYLGPTFSAERLLVKHNDQTATAWKPALGIIGGWDIRVTRTGTSVLRTNLRWVPNLHLESEGEKVLFENLEFNFIQYVVFLGRKKFYHQQFSGKG